MESSRLPRFARASQVPALQITRRDREIIRLVHEHRFLRSSHIISLISGSPQQILRRLKLLYHHGYLERPRSQLDYYHKGGSREIVYGLSNRGAAVLQEETGSPIGKKWRDKNSAIGRIFLEHALLVADVMVAIELACRNAGIRLLTERELSAATGRIPNEAFRWKVKVNGQLKLGVVPDRVFALERKDQNGEINRTVFFLEGDRGTMPVIRKSLSETSFYRKLLGYEATWSQSVHRTRFGFDRFRVLTVTTSAGRVKSLVDACSQLKRGQGLFLFTDWTTLEKSGDPFSPIWQTGRGSTPESLLN